MTITIVQYKHKKQQQEEGKQDELPNVHGN